MKRTDEGRIDWEQIKADNEERRLKWLAQIHKTHKMGKEKCEVRTPCCTPRFYGVTKCENCGYEYIQHPAGRFMDRELKEPCGRMVGGEIKWEKELISG